MHRSHSTVPGKRFGRRGPKAKSGCRTCKIRRVKCDETRPACQRCLTTKRTCDGYGIWDSGIYGNNHPVSTSCSNDPKAMLHIVLPGGLSKDERNCFEWFLIRTRTKIPGIFGSIFWDQMVCQASLQEPAVFYAVLALSSAHKSEMQDGNSLEGGEEVPDEQEQFTLRQYTKAISHLYRHLSTEDNQSLHVALVSCMVFICLEFLRGRHKAGSMHLQNGMRLLGQAQSQPQLTTTEEAARTLKPRKMVVDGNITEAYTRVYTQSALFGHFFAQSYFVEQAPGWQDLPPFFQSTKQARCHLDKLLNQIHNIIEQSHLQAFSNSIYTEELLYQRECTRADLLLWLRAYKASQVHLSRENWRDKFAYKLLRIYYTVANIMANTCLSPTGESAFDLYTQDFASIITQSVDLWKAASSLHASDVSSGHKGFTFTADYGLIPPLYFTAIKCRVARIRRQAVKWLLSLGHSEGIWNGTVAAHIAQEVIRIEERDFYKSFQKNDVSPLGSIPAGPGSALPMLPELYRIHEIQLKMLDDTAGIILAYKQYDIDGSWKFFEKMCNILK